MPNPFTEYDPTVPPDERKFPDGLAMPSRKFPEPLARLGDSLDGPGDPHNVFLIFRESDLLAWSEKCDPSA